jgi:hypothetical protein
VIVLAQLLHVSNVRWSWPGESTRIDPGPSKSSGVPPPTGSIDAIPPFAPAAGSRSTVTPPARLPTIRVSSSTKSRLCGSRREEEASCSSRVTATRGPAAVIAISMSATAIRSFAKQAIASRRPLGANRMSSVRPSVSSAARTSRGASKSSWRSGEPASTAACVTSNVRTVAA